MEMIESDDRIRRSLETIIADHLKSEQEQVGPFKRLLLQLNRWRIRTSLSDFLGFHLTRPMEFVDDDQLTFSERWQRFMGQRSSSRLYLSVVGSLLVSSALTTVNFYFQYTYDFNLAILREIKTRARINATHSNTSELVVETQQRAQAARAQLKSLGSAHVEWLFVAQMINLYFWLYAVAYIIGTAYVRYRDQDNFSWLRWLLDEKAECKSRAKLTLSEVSKVQRAMILASEIEYEEIESAAAGFYDPDRFDPGAPLFEDAPTRRRKSSYVLARIESRRDSVGRRHLLVLDQFKRVALAGRLNPLNRTRHSIHSLEVRMYISDLIQYVIFVFYAFFWYNQFKHLLACNGLHVEYTSYRDYIQAFNFAYPVLLCYIVCIPITSFNLVVGHDQAQSVSKLKSLFMKTISSNEVIYRKLLSPTLTSPGESSARALEEHLDLNLMTLLIQYRLFAAEYRLALRPYRYFGAIYISLIFIMPLLIRSHSPYMLDDLKPFSFLAGLLAPSPSLLFFLPLCYVQRQCIETYKLLNSLLAQSIEYMPTPAPDNCSSHHDILNQIRRELIEPEKALDKFSCRVLTQEITYASMLKMVFWVGLIQLPIFNRSKSDDIVGQFLDDPFGIFKVLN